MKMAVHPCTRECPKRNSVCHSSCGEYLAYEKQHALDMVEVRKARDEYRIYTGGRIEIIEKTKKVKCKY